jgi:hypothetical protein
MPIQTPHIRHHRLISYFYELREILCPKSEYRYIIPELGILSSIPKTLVLGADWGTLNECSFNDKAI